MGLWRIILVGKTERGYPAQGVDYYRSRIQPLHRLEWVEIRSAVHSARDLRLALEAEAEAVLKRLAPQDWVVMLDERGKEPSSTEFAQWLGEWESRRGGPIAFVVGGAYGLDSRVSSRADQLISLSRLTFPHQLVRVVLLEQLYRALTLQSGHGYHHQ